MSDRQRSGAVQRRLDALASLHVSDQGPEERFDRITRTARDTFGVAGAFLNLAGAEVLTHKSQQSDQVFPGSTPLRDTFCGRTLHQDGPVLVPDATADDRFADLPMVRHNPNVRFYAGVPLHIGDEATKVGTLCLIDPTPQSLTIQQLSLLEDLGRWAERELATGLEIDRTRRVITALQSTPLTLNGVTIQAAPEPGTSGMWHWRGIGTRLRFTIVEVTGSGPAAALLAAPIRSFLAASDDDPVTAVAGVHRHFAPQLEQARAVAAVVCGVIDTTTGSVEYINAGSAAVTQQHADGTVTAHHDTVRPIGLHTLPQQASTLILTPGERITLNVHSTLPHTAVPKTAQASITISRAW